MKNDLFQFLIFLVHIFYVKSELMRVIEVNRHGARSPAVFEDLINSEIFVTGAMELTFNGYRQHQILGEYVRYKYIYGEKFLKEDYSSRQFRIISSPVQRTLFSAMGFISGIYPDCTPKMETKGISGIRKHDELPLISSFLQKSKPEIPIFIEDPDHDLIFHAEKCKLGEYSVEELLAASTMKEFFNLTKEEILHAEEVLTEYLGLNNISNGEFKDTGVKLYQLVKYYYPYIYHFPKKENLDSKTLSTLQKFNLNKWYSSRLKANEKQIFALKLTDSAFFDVLAKEFQNATLNRTKLRKENEKLTVFSGHDTLIVNILASILSSSYLKEKLTLAAENQDVYNFLVPSFASSLFFELHYFKETNSYSVKIVYNGKEIDEGFDYGIKSKNEFISYNDFQILIKNCIDKTYTNLQCSKDYLIEP